VITEPYLCIKQNQLSQMINKISIEVLDQLKAHLNQLTQEEYAQKLAIFNGASIGAHTRHVIEFYQCLLNGMKSGLVNYDARKRDLRIEQQLLYTIDLIDEIKYRLLNTITLNKTINLITSYGAVQFAVPTNFERESVYLIEHSIHHFALIRIGLQECFPTVAIEPNFGYAHSTIQHQKEKKALASTLTH
jgi:hypothetical protein